MASSSKRLSKDYEDSYEMSPERAKRLFDSGGILLVRDFPVGHVFGIDMKVYQVGEKFLGIKMIPPGLHYIYYSAVSKDGSTAPRAGFFHYYKSKEILVTKWDKENEDIIIHETSEEETERIRSNLYNLDKCLGAYPYQTLSQWNRLTCNISETLVKKLQPLSGVVRSVTELIPLKFPIPESVEPDSTSDKRSQTLEEKYLPDMKKVPGTEIRFTEIPKTKYPEGSTAAEITKHSMDSTYVLEQLLSTYEKEDDLLGELQMAHICFLIAHVYDAFEHWKSLVTVVCSVDLGISKYSNILKLFLSIFHYQLKEIPTDFFVDITSENNFLVSTLQGFFENVKNSAADDDFKIFADHFRQNLTTVYRWDFENIPDDEKPVIVQLED